MVTSGKHSNPKGSKSSSSTSGTSTKKRKQPDSNVTTITGSTATNKTATDNSVVSAIAANVIPKMNWDPIRSKLLSKDLKVSLDAVMNLRDKIEIVHSTEYPAMLANVLPAFGSILKTTPCMPPPNFPAPSGGSSPGATGDDKEQKSSTISTGVDNNVNAMNESSHIEHRLRNSILELSSRLPQNEFLRPYASVLLSMVMDVLHKDYEDNALLASRIIFDLHKNYRPLLVEYVQPFLDFVTASYRGLGTSVQRNFLFPIIHPHPSHSHSTGTNTPHQQQPHSQSKKSPTHFGSNVPPGPSMNNTTNIPATYLPPPAPSAAAGVAAPPNLNIPNANVNMNINTMVPQKQQSQQPMIIGAPTIVPKISTTVPPSNTPPVLSVPPSTSTSPVPHLPPKQLPNYSYALKSSSSFRILTECPLTVMLLFQLYPKYLKNNINQLLPLMMDALAQRPPPQGSSILLSSSTTSSTGGTLTSNKQAPAAASQQATIQKLYYMRTRELLSAQVKTFSFLTYLLRGYSEQMKTYEDRIASNVLSLLTHCHREAIATRKELLVALRHMLATDFCKGFFRHVDSLLDERVLIGTHRQSEYLQLRPLAYSALADLLHQVRQRLSMGQTLRAVHLYSRILHDASMNLGLSIQMTSVRLILNMVDHVYHNKEEKASSGRNILFRILEVLVWKLGMLVEYGIDDVLKLEAESKLRRMRDEYEMGIAGPDDLNLEGHSRKKRNASTESVDAIEEETKEREQRRRDKMYNTSTTEKKDTLQNLRDLIKPMLIGLKTVIWCINNYGNGREKLNKAKDNQNSGDGTNSSSSADSAAVKGASSAATADVDVSKAAAAGDVNMNQKNSQFEAEALEKITPSERVLVNKYIEWGFKSLRVFKSVDMDDFDGDDHNEKAGGEISASAVNDSTRSTPIQVYKHMPCPQYCEVLEIYASSLTVLDGFNFQQIVGQRMDFLLDALIKDQDVLTVFKHFLKSSSITYDFASCLLTFLLDQMKDLSMVRRGLIPLIQMDEIGSKLSDKDLLMKQNRLVERKGTVFLNIFEAIFASMSSFSQNEAALRPHLQVLVSTCIAHAMEHDENSWPGTYLTLLKSLFRAIAGGKFEESYKELLPLLPTILNGLYRVYCSTDHEQLRYAIIELCLTLPARLSSLLPHLSLLMRIIIPALQTESGELINLGLRTLEFWVDNLNPEFLFPILSQQTDIFSELMVSLSNHLRPAPYPYGLLTLRLLGKLGGKNRHFLREPMDFYHTGDTNAKIPALNIECAWLPSLCLFSTRSKDENSENRSEDRPSTNKVDKNIQNEVDGAKSKSEFDTFAIPLPLQRAVAVLKLVVEAPSLEKYLGKQDPDLHNFNNNNLSVAFLRNIKMENVSLEKYENTLLDDTKRNQAEAAFGVIRSAVAVVLDMKVNTSDRIKLNVGREVKEERKGEASTASQKELNHSKRKAQSFIEEGRNSTLNVICEGLFYATQLDFLKEDANLMLEGFAAHVAMVVVTNHDMIERIDANGNSVEYFEEIRVKTDDDKVSVGGTKHIFERDSYMSSGKLQPLTPFGCFRFSGKLKMHVDLFTLNKSIAVALSQGKPGMKKTALNLILKIANIFKQLEVEITDKVETSGESVRNEQHTSKQKKRCTEIFFESLLYNLCQSCLSNNWIFRSGIFDGICKVIDLMGTEWSRQFEVEIMHTALFCIKDSPNEIAYAEKVALTFFIRICWQLYEGPQINPDELVRDVLSLPDDLLSPITTVAAVSTERFKNPTLQGSPSSETILAMLVGELGSTKQLMRFAIRYGLRHILSADKKKATEALFSKHNSVLKRLLFSRSLRNLPLQDQIAIIEALAYIIKEAPSIIPISDNLLLAFLKELLKMLSVADGEMASDSVSDGVIINKDGYSLATESNSSMISKTSSLSHASAIFLRSEFIIEDKLVGGRIVVPGELPLGIQLRVSSLILFSAVIKSHTNAFFDAAPTTSMGNIRPHVISLLFRSLTSKPEQAVLASHAALRDVLFLSMTPKEGVSGHQSLTHRLPRQLLQTCIRPVLVNLRDYTRLTTHLLRGLSRLLSLLSSWFSKTLGEKLLDHLHRWGEPEKIKGLHLWKEGEEPLVASAIIELFELLPDASHFVEPLVKITIKLETVLPRYNSCLVCSPYRAPLARYLNKHCEAVAHFFLNEKRLKNPIYSDLLQDIVRRDDSVALRSHLSGDGCSNTLLNICFERPLAIIRAEKSSAGIGVSSRSQSSIQSLGNSPRHAAGILSMHGISIDTTSTSQRQKELALRQDCEIKKKKHHMAKQEEARAKDMVQNLISSNTVISSTGSSAVEKQSALNEAKRKHQVAYAAMEKSKKDFNTTHQEYSTELAKTRNEAQKIKDDIASQMPRSMSLDALELQLQGFCLVETLVSKDQNYIRNHNAVVRAFRWLWRSKGRHLRLLHDGCMPPRYNSESRVLARFLVNYAKTCYPSDGDVLFDLLRIFLQPAATDFTFIQSFLRNMVCNVLTKDKKKRVMPRFFALLASEGSEETKVLSIQLLILPMVKNDFETEVKSVNFRHATEIKEIQTQNESEKDGKGKLPNFAIDHEIINKFVNEALLHRGNTRVYGHRLNVELLKLASVLLEFMVEEMSAHRKYLIKFAWPLLKSEDIYTKHWAYIFVCRFIAMYDTPTKIILQVYVAMLRSNQQEAKDLVRIALDIMIPALLRRLSADDYIKAINVTIKVLYEEGNSLPQLAHVWHTIVRHRNSFFRYRDKFAPLAVISLNKLGLPMASSYENRELSIDLVELLLSWEFTQKSCVENDLSPNLSFPSTTRNKSTTNASDFDHTIFASLGSPESSPTKKLKVCDGELKNPSDESKLQLNLKGQDNPTLLVQSQVDMIVNFLVRFILLVTGQDNSQQKLGKRANKLFKRYISHWDKSEIRSGYFDKLVSMCVEEAASLIVSSSVSTLNGPEQKLKEKNLKGKSGTKGNGKPPGSSKSAVKSSANATNVSEENKPVPVSLLLSSLDLFIDILESAPKNNFLHDNVDKVIDIIGSCFIGIRDTENNLLRKKLKKFLTLLFCHQDTSKEHISLLDKSKKMLEMSLSNFLDQNETSKSKVVSQTFQLSSTEDKDSPEEDNKSTDATLSILFVLQTLEEICEMRPNFVEYFVGTLISVTEKISKEKLTTISRSSRNAATSNSRVVSSLSAVFEKACKKETTVDRGISNKLKGVALSKEEGSWTNNSQEIAPELHCLICCVRLIGSSNIPFYFTTNRKKFFLILSEILDTSDNIYLLLTVIVQLGKWLTMEGYGPVTKNEKDNFVSKMKSLDCRGLPEVTAQILFHLVAFILLKVEFCCSRKGKFHVIETPPRKECNRFSETFTKSDQSKFYESDSSFQFSSPIISCLMTTNLKLGPFFDVLYGTDELIYASFQKKLVNLGRSFDSHTGHPLGVVGRSPIDLLRHLLSSDFEALGRRLWSMVFVNMLIGISSHLGGVKLFASQVDVEMANKTSCEADVDHWIPSPRLISHCAGSSVQSEDYSISIDNNYPLYQKFREMIIAEKSTSGFGRGRCLNAIRSLASCDVSLCQDLLEYLLPKAWSVLPSDETRAVLTKRLEKLISRPFHSQFLRSPVLKKQGYPTALVNYRSINVIQSLLRAVSKFQPLPMLDLDVLMSLAADYNCWHEVKCMIEQQLFVLKKNQSVNSKSYQSKLHSMIQRCYLELGERDIWMSLQSDSCSLPGTKRATSLDMYNRIEDALDAYSSLIDQAQTSQEVFSARTEGGLTLPSDMDLSLWEDRWIALHRELCQWDLLTDFAEETGSIKLQMECAWKRRDWDRVRSLYSSPSIIGALESGDFEVKMSEIFLAIADGKLNDVENLHAQTAQLCLYKWQLLPSLFSGCNAHNDLLHHFHRLVDIRESGQIMVETSAHSSGRTYPDLKNLLSAWRHRLPNDFDPISSWEDIFQWRSHMFTVITTNFQWIEQGTLATLHDRPWTAIRMAKTARKQRMKDVALMSLGKLTDCAMDVSDAFSKLREQILSYKDGSNIERTGGLNLVNTTNLSYFDSNQKSELFRLKAEFLESLGERSKATQAFCHAVQVCPSYSRAWISWGDLCCSLADMIEKQSQVSNSPEYRERAAANAKKASQYLAQGMGCYLEAIQCESSESSRSHIPHCLWMLAKDGTASGLLCSTFEKYTSSLPVWIWLPWIPQLLTSLCRIESRAAKVLLNGIVLSYPQAVYFPLRSFYLERRDIERSRGKSANTGQNQSVSYAEDLMVSALRKTHLILWSSLETVLEELFIRFRPSYDEELLTTVTALLQRADSQLEHQKRSGSSDESDDAVRASFCKNLARVSAKFFTPHTDPSSTSKDDRGRKSKAFTQRYKVAFENDFSMGAPGVERLTINEIITKLKKWKCILEAQVALSPSFIPLMQASPSLSSFSNAVPDLWPGACDPAQIDSKPLRKRRSDSEIAGVQSTSASATAAESVASAAAKAVSAAATYEGGGGHYGGGSAVVEIPGQYPPNSGNLFDSRPAPELHAKLVRFESTVEVSSRNDQLVRKIGMVGSDGIVHHFLLQLTVPYWTRTDERTSQLNYFFGKILRKESISSRRNLWLKPTAVIPIAQRLRMTYEEKSYLSLEDIYTRFCWSKGFDQHAPAHFFQEEVNKETESAINLEPAKKADVERNAKLNAFHTICEKMVDSRILTRHMQKSLFGAEQMFQFQINFTAQVALNSLFQYCFHVNERSPSKFMFNSKNAQVLSPDFRFSYGNQGFLDGKKNVPFRMTRNIETLIGPHLLEGVFIPAMASAAAAICANEKELEPMLRLLLRDDIVSWYVSKSSQREGVQRSTEELERQLGDRITKNVVYIQDRLKECAPNDTHDESKGSAPIDAGVRRLLDVATTPENQASMSYAYCAWL